MLSPDEAAQAMVDRFGYETAIEKATKARDMNSWGTYSYALHNETLKAIKRIKESNE